MSRPPLPLGKEPLVRIGQEAGWAPRTGLDDVERTILLQMGLELRNFKYDKKYKVNLKIKQSMVKCINIYVFLYAKTEPYWKM
jgi:hypothetical protein